MNTRHCKACKGPALKLKPVDRWLVGAFQTPPKSAIASAMALG